MGLVVEEGKGEVMKVYLDADEQAIWSLWEKGSESTLEIEVDEDTLNRWKDADKHYQAAQEEGE